MSHTEQSASLGAVQPKCVLIEPKDNSESGKMQEVVAWGLHMDLVVAIYYQSQ